MLEQFLYPTDKKGLIMRPAKPCWGSRTMKQKNEEAQFWKNLNPGLKGRKRSVLDFSPRDYK